MKGLGQVLKSFRDRDVDFTVYDRASGVDAYLGTLGPLEIPQQGTRAGLHVDVPAQRVHESPTYKGLPYDTVAGTHAEVMAAIPDKAVHQDAAQHPLNPRVKGTEKQSSG